MIHHGLMMVGPSGSGKSMAWRVLLKALERLEGVEGVAHVIDPKVGVILYLAKKKLTVTRPYDKGYYCDKEWGIGESNRGMRNGEW